MTVEEALEALAWDCVLDASTSSVRDLGRDPPFVRPSVLSSNALHDAFIVALQNDAVLAQLFPDDDEAKGRIRSHRPSSVAHQLLNAALWDCARQPSVTADCVLEHVRSGVDALRGLAGGVGVNVPVWVGFGCDLPAGTEVVTPYGVLRSWGEPDRFLLSQATTGEPTPEHGAVLDAHTTVYWDVSSTAPAGTIYCVGIEDERWQRLALALLLVQGADNASPTLPWFCCQAQALSSGIASSEVRQFIKGPALTDKDVRELAQWIDLVTNPHLNSIAVTRALSMVSRITGHVDALVDGVIVWENLFGTGDAQELAYRVSMNMACVITDDRLERVALQSAIKRLYKERSLIVHGGRHPSPSQASDLRDEVQRLTLRALRSLLTNHPDLIGADTGRFVRFVMTSASGDSGA